MQTPSNQNQIPQFDRLVKDLEIFVNLNGSDYPRSDYKSLLNTMSKQYGIKTDLLLKGGFKRAYRQIVEGI